jgi:hypothetical protein
MEQPTILCPNCGRGVPPSQRLCPHCGAAILPDPVLTGSTPSRPEEALLSKSRGWDIFIGIVFGTLTPAVLVGILALLSQAPTIGVVALYSMPITVAVPVLIFLRLNKQYRLFARAYAYTAGILYVVLPLLVVLGLFVVCLVALGSAGGK